MYPSLIRYETVAKQQPEVRMSKIGFRVLGPLHVCNEDRCLHLKSPRQQVVLAALLLNANRLVPVESLIKAVWDDGPPEGARHQIQNCASMLRRRIRDIGVSEVEIIGYPAGYTMHVSEGRLDATVFDRQVAEARELAAEGRLATAAGRLRSALSLWLGAPLAGVPGRIMQQEATRLAERRLSAQEDWIDLEMALGGSAQVTAELYRLVSEHPFRERLRAQLMLSLYRSGRTAEALAVYRQTWQMFADELGLEPSPVLKGLETAILRGDPALWRPPLARDPFDGEARVEYPIGAFGGIA
ncbi:AfsR/SARP family transcriptional regulator [Sphaerisporangium sp. NPDC051017]|uniref:AfsR/SARP family transcriptional regulator n=1 Tax=Sphaerisporangium sp. NPDC051017 TaxID=3154636 RepID=UPI003421A664